MSREEFYRQAEILENCLVDWEDGQAVRMTPAHGRHGLFISHLLVPLRSHLRKNRLGSAWSEVFMDFPDRTFGVDIAVLMQEHLKQYRAGRVQGPADVVLEVLSPDSVSRDRGHKFNMYWKYQVPWYWIGDARAGTLEEYRHTPDGYLRTTIGTLDQPFEPQAVPGFTIDLNELMDEGGSEQPEP